MKKTLRALLPFLILALTVLACGPQLTATPFVAGTGTPPSPFTPTPAARSLTICLGEEPTTLYPYGNLNSAARSVLAAIYDGPIEAVDYKYEAIILEKIPDLKDGDAQITPVTVNAGDEVVDTTGNVVTLDTGVKVRPSACRSDDCAVTYDGSSSLKMDQMVVTFTMLKGLMWSDGSPLTSSDSIYSYKLASDEATPTSKYLVEHTASYEAADDQTVQWWGKPGFIDPEYYTNFWMPLPEHAWKDFQAADLVKSDISSKYPMGWGPYIIDQWEAGKRLHLVKNLNYFRADSGLPKFDELTFLIVPDANAAVSDLMQGTCDLLDPSTRLDSQVGLLQQLRLDERARLLTAETNVMEWLGFGVTPASYDDGFDIKKDRPDYFGDKRMRQAIAYCLDRQKIVDTVLYGLSDVPDSYVSPAHPLYNPSVQKYEFDPATGNQMLDQMGWRDQDNNPATPREAFQVTNVPVGTPLVLNYYTTMATQRHQVAEILTQSLSECGIGVNVIYSDASTHYAQGPDGPLFGRHFDLAEYAIGVDSLEPQCSWFTSSQIPNEANHWAGTNVTGYEDPNFDAACQKSLQTVPTDPEYAFHQEAQAIFATELPAIPLYLRLRVAATRPDFCGFTLDASSASALADIEAFDYGKACEP